VRGARARAFSTANDFLFLGAASTNPIALEGALKLKEISYIPRRGLGGCTPPARLSTGPNALIDETLPVVVIATRTPTTPPAY